MEPDGLAFANLVILITPVIGLCLIAFMDRRPSWPSDDEF